MAAPEQRVSTLTPSSSPDPSALPMPELPTPEGQRATPGAGARAGATPGRALSARVRRHGRVPSRQRTLPLDSGRRDAPVRLRAASPRRRRARHRRVGPDRPADDRRVAAAARHAAEGDRRPGLGHPGDAQEVREQPAGARGRHRELPAAAAQGGRHRRGVALGREAHERHQPDHQADRLDRLCRAAAARQRHPHRDARRCGGGEVPGRRRAAAGDAPDRQAVRRADHLAHQGDGRTRHRREARAAGRPLQAAHARQDDRLPRLGDAERARRGRGHPHPRQGIDQRAVPRAPARHPRVSRGGTAALPQVHPRALRHGARHRARPARARPRRSTRRCPRSSRSRTRSSPSRTRSNTS